MTTPDISICIPTRGNGLGLWATVNSCEVDLAHSGINYEYCIVQNGDKNVDGGVRVLLDALEKVKKLGFSHITKGIMSPPAARQLASNNASGRLLAFFDNHAIVKREYFKRAIADFDKYDMDLLHSATEFHPQGGDTLHYNLKLKTNFWGEATMLAPTWKPYRIAAGGHGGFLVRRSVWEETGGYGPENLFHGYAGEELTVDLKMWMLGKSVWMDPRLVHCHYVGPRGYGRHFSDDFYINLMVSANVIGGQKWMEGIATHFLTSPRTLSDMTMYDLMKIAYMRSHEYAEYVRSVRKMDLDELLKFFSDNQIEYR